jgi:predicted AlkP superfamily pyrophosphatase or phosphodiesterase
MSKLLVFCIDALCAEDTEKMRLMPHFGPMLKNGSFVRNIMPVWPALTYCCHTSILTGCYVDKHGIYHNEKFSRGGRLKAPWFSSKRDVRTHTLLDLARARGLSTCSLSWPVSGGADYDMNMPMIVPYDYIGWEPEKWLDGSATKNLMERYYYKHGRYIMGPDRSLDLLTMALALDILEDYDQPDVMLIKMCDLDSCRHTFGVHHPNVDDQLRKHDAEFGAVVEALRRKGTLGDTNLVILGDHGMTDVQDVLLLNVLLRRQGFLQTDGDGNIIGFDAVMHSTGLCAYVELRDPSDAAVKERVRAYLETLKEDPSIRLEYVMDAARAKSVFHVEGPFDFILTSALPIAFGEKTDGDAIWGSQVPGDHIIGAATHGGAPDREALTTFIACGPDVKKGVVVERRSMVDEAPTMAGMLGFDMPEADGTAIKQMLRSDYANQD